MGLNRRFEKILKLCITTLPTQLYLRVDILLTSGKHLHKSFISLRGEVWAHTTSIPPFSTHTFFIEAHLPSQESMGHVYACWEYRFLPLILRLFDSNLELSRMCCILCLSLNILKQLIVKNIPKLVRYFQQKLPIITLYNHRKTKIQWVHV